MKSQKYIKHISGECSLFQNTLFERDLIGLQARIYIRQGLIDKAIETIEGAIKQSTKFHLEDKGLAMILGDYGEILYERKKHKEA